MRRLTWMVLLVACALPAAAGVYKWTDADGRVHYTDSPPPDRKATPVKIKVSSITGPATISALPASATKQASSAGKERVRMYITAWCGYCKKARALLAARRVPFDEIDIEASQSGKREFDSLGGRGVPVILVGGQRMDGFDAAGLETMLAAAGY